MTRTRLALIASLTLTGLELLACDRKQNGDSAPPDGAPIPIATTREVVPPVASFNATPVAEFADAGNLDTQPPYEQAKVFHAQGQLWMARLVLERKALGSDATKEETELLVRICQEQVDAACVDACAKKLGRKIKMQDGGTPAIASASAVEHKEPDTELARARDLVLKMQYEPARKTLEPKVLDGKASREEIRMLRTVCEKQGDRMCVALCDSKLK
jgi:hypothetical protein